MNGNLYLDELESKSVYIIREAYWEYRDNLAILWSMGKDSTTLVHLARKAFLEKVPIRVIHIDTTFKFKEIYEFREKYVKEWNLKLIIAKNDIALKEGMSPEKGRFNCCNALKTEALKQVIEKYNLKALFVAIRRDEHAIRAKERYFSLRDREFKWNYQNQALELWQEYYKTEGETGTHFRIHPLLHWREIDIWRYIKKERLPVVNLYFSQKNKRYRSIGCECCCQPIESRANTIDKIIKEIQDTRVSERSGRAQDKEREYMMQKLRSLGYM
jgi:sulfate adenylyltransferase subunit 2